MRTKKSTMVPFLVAPLLALSAAVAAQETQHADTPEAEWRDRCAPAMEIV